MSDPRPYLAAVALTCRDLVGGDEVFLVQGVPPVVWRAGAGCRDPVAEAALHDVPVALARPVARTALPGLGRFQLAIVLPRGGWVLARSSRRFDAGEVARAAALRPLVVALDRATSADVVVAAADDNDDAEAAADDNDDHDTVAAGDDVAAWAALSPRERQVVDLLVAGCTAQRMGSILGISPRTVGKHLQNAYDKLGHHDRLLIAVRHGRVSAGV